MSHARHASKVPHLFFEFSQDPPSRIGTVLADEVHDFVKILTGKRGEDEPAQSEEPIRFSKA